MRIAVCVTLALATSVLSAIAADKPASPVVSETQRAQIKSQVESLQNAKFKAAQTAGETIKGTAERKGQAIDEQTKRAKERVQRTADEMSWRYGPEWSTAAGQARKQQLDAAARAGKAKIAAEAQKQAAAEMAAAKKSAENINQSVQGLKSQVAPKGQYGLQPKGSNLYVRQYGKSK